MTTQISETTLKIRWLKEELKRLSKEQKEIKKATKHNESVFDCVVTKGIQEAIKEHRLKKDTYYPNCAWAYNPTEVYKALHQEAEASFREVPKRSFGFRVLYKDQAKSALTAGYILYNNLRGVKPHLGSKDREHEYMEYIKKWNERFESHLEEEESDDKAASSSL